MARLPNHRELSWAISSIIDESLCNYQHHLLLVFNCCSNKEFEFAYSYEEIAKIARINRSTVIRKVKVLLKKEYISLLEKGNIYTLSPNKFRLNSNKILS